MVLERMPAQPLITGALNHKKHNGKIKPRKVTFGSMKSEGVHYIDIYHESNQKLKYKIRIDKENFAGIEMGDTLLESGMFRKKLKKTNYFAIILKTTTVLFHIDDNHLDRWQQTIRKELKHKSKWDGKLVQPQERSNISLQLMSSVISFIDKTYEPHCLIWWKVNDIEQISIVNNIGIKLEHKLDGVVIFQPSHGLRVIFEDLKDLAQINNIDVIILDHQPMISPHFINSPPSPDPHDRPTKSLRRSSSVLPPEDLEVNPQYHYKKKKSIKGTPLNNFSLQVPPSEEHYGNISRTMSDPNLYYNQFSVDAYKRQVSDNPVGSSSDSISKFYEEEYDYSSPVMNFVYHYLCKRQEDAVPNVLQIGGITRRKLGLKLFNISTPETGSWKDLSSELCEMSVKDADYFSCLRQQQLCTQGLTETEMVLKYWENMASTYDDTEYRKHFKYACTRNELILLLRYLNREDLADLVERSAIR